MEQTKIWAHRGSSRKHLENTLPAFKQAIEDGADGIELDVQRTKDGELVVYHDENLKRLTAVDKFIWDLTWDELKELTLSAKGQEDAKIPLLKDVLPLIQNSNIFLNIELKNSINIYPYMEKQVLRLVSEYNLLNRVVFSSFNHESIRRMSDLIGPEQCGLLTSDILFEPWSYLERIGAKSYHPMVNSLQQKHLIKECRKRGIKVNVWTADSEFLVSAGLLVGVDTIITNYPDKAMVLREQFEKDGGLQAVKAVRDSGFPLVEEGYYG